MSNGAYVLARFSDSEKLLPAIANLKTFENVQRWNAVEGHVSLVIKFQAISGHITAGLKKIEGIKDLLSYETISDGDDKQYFDPKFCYTYIFIESESRKILSILDCLRKMENVVCSSSVKGGCDLVAVVRGESFKIIDHIINENIRILDGILRMKSDRIINLNEI